MKKSVLWASLTMFGGIIGAGIFGVPFVFSRAGVLVGLAYIVFLGAAAALINVYYAVVAVETPGRHRLAGYARKLTGKKASVAVAVVSMVEFFGALLVYVILGGNFLSVIFGGAAGLWSLVFLAVAAFVLLLPLKKSEWIDHLFTVALIVAVAAIAAMLVPQIKTANIVSVHWENWFAPYGVLFFALGGSSVIPEMIEVSRRDKRSAVQAVAVGTIAAAVLIAIFGVIIVGVCGAGTTEDAIAGLARSFGRPIVILGSVFGLAAVLTQFVVIGSNIRDEFVYDFKKQRIVGWALTVGIPLLAFSFGARDFVSIIGFLGATLGAGVGIIIIYMGRKVMEENGKYALLRRFAVPLMMLFLAGLLAEIISVLL